MRFITSASVMVTVLACAVSLPLHAQLCNPGPTTGNSIGSRARIVDAGNVCDCDDAYNLKWTLHLVDSDQPGLRLSNNYTSEACSGDIHGDLYIARHQRITCMDDDCDYVHSEIQAPNDYCLVADQTANNLLLSTRNPGKRIIFATTQTAVDAERMTITDIGHVGIATNNPKELLHIGAKMTFHVGTFEDYLGYNVYRDGTDVDRLIMDEPGTPIGQALKFGATRYGIIEMGAGKTSTGALTDEVDWYEGTGRPYGLEGNTKSFAGLTIKEYGGKGCASFGRHVPDADSRVFIKSFSGTNACALKIVSSANAEILRVGDDGKVGIGTTAPKAVLHVNGDVVIGANKCTTTISSTLANRLSVDGAICTKEIWVKLGTTWADYVFADDYILPPLAEIDSFIGANKRLPGVPSAAEVEENGVSLGEMQVVLLKKVEELTLYIIEMNKKNVVLEQRVQELLDIQSLTK